MLNRVFFALVAVREIRPTCFTYISVIIYNKIISKARPILTMHSQHEFLLHWLKLALTKWFTHSENKTILKVILLILPLWRWSPSNWTKSSNYISELSADHSQCIIFTITDLMKSFCREIMLCCSVKELNIVNIFLEEFLYIIDTIFK